MLVVGASGLVGHKACCSAGIKAVGTYNSHPARVPCRTVKMDVLKAAAVRKLLSDESPDAVINTAALHNVDYCENHPAEAGRLNADAAGGLAEACSDAGARLVHVSTDYVFDGTKKTPYSEEDAPGPLNAYGATKAEGERRVLTAGHAVVRTSVVYGVSPSALRSPGSGMHSGFVMWVLRSLSRGESLRVVDDQEVTPTFSDALASALLEVARDGRGGLLHAAGASCESRYSLASKAAEIFGYEPSMVSPIRSADLAQAARRPARVCLDSSKAERELGIAMPSADEGLRAMRVQAEVEAPGLVRDSGGTG